MPAAKSPNYILISGATVWAMRDRVMALAHAVDVGALKLQPETQIVFLDGERPLFSSETASVLTNTAPYEADPNWVIPTKLPTDEFAAAQMVWAQLKLARCLT